MEGERVITKVLYNDISGYDVVAYRSRAFVSYEQAYYAVANVLLESVIKQSMLSSEGSSRESSDIPDYRKYIFEAYADGLLVDRIVFVCRNT